MTIGNRVYRVRGPGPANTLDRPRENSQPSCVRRRSTVVRKNCLVEYVRSVRAARPRTQFAKDTAVWNCLRLTVDG